MSDVAHYKRNSDDDEDYFYFSSLNPSLTIKIEYSGLGLSTGRLIMYSEQDTSFKKPISVIGDLKGYVRISDTFQAMEFVRLRTHIRSFSFFDKIYQEVSCERDTEAGVRVPRNLSICKTYITAPLSKKITLGDTDVYLVKRFLLPVTSKKKGAIIQVEETVTANGEYKFRIINNKVVSAKLLDVIPFVYTD